MNPRRRHSAPAISTRGDVLAPDIEPGDEREEDDHHKDGADVGRDCRGDLMGSPKGQREGDEVDCLPEQLEEQDGDHLDGIAKAEERGGSETGEQAELDAMRCGEPGCVMDDVRPDVECETAAEDEIGQAQCVEAEQRDGGQDVTSGVARL